MSSMYVINVCHQYMSLAWNISTTQRKLSSSKSDYYVRAKYMNKPGNNTMWCRFVYVMHGLNVIQLVNIVGVEYHNRDIS